MRVTRNKFTEELETGKIKRRERVNKVEEKA